MSVLAVASADPTGSRGALSRRNPAAKLSGVALITLGMLLTRDPLTPALVLAAELALLPFAGIGLAALWRRSWPLLLAAGGLLLTNVLLGDAAGGITVAVRALAVALPGILVLAVTDPVDLADSLVQQWHAPPRFAYGALAALRLLPLLALEWHAIALARRARGIDAGRNPLAGAGLFSTQVFALLVLAIRRATRLAAAMDARGFDAPGPRTCARQQRVRPADVVLVLAVALILAVALGISAGLGVLDTAFG